MSYKHPYKCNECGFRWRDVKLKEGLVRCVRCGSKNIENVETRKFFGIKTNAWVLLIICSISSLILGSVLTFVYYEYLSTSTIILWWVIPAGFYVGFFVPIFWWFDDWSFFLGLKHKVWIVLFISVISSIIIGSVLSILYYNDLSIFDVGFWWVIPLGFVGGFLIPIVYYLFAEWKYYLDKNS